MNWLRVVKKTESGSWSELSLVETVLGGTGELMRAHRSVLNY